MKKINRRLQCFSRVARKEGQFDFSWLFAIVVGGAILALAIYGAMRIGDTERFQTDTEVAKKIAILTDPLQAGFSEGKVGKIIFNSETKINNICFDEGFGKNDISVSTKSRIGDEWVLSGGATSIHNKYIFSSSGAVGETFYAFSKPLYLPFKVADLVFLTTEDYCFVDAPEEIVDEVSRLGIPNIRTENCTENSEKVCFGGTMSSECVISVKGTCTSGCDSIYDEGYVVKPEGKLTYTDGLLYGAIFSDKGTYDCNVRRLMYRTAKLTEMFSEKADIMSMRGCGTQLKGDMILLGGMTINASASDLPRIKSLAENMNSRNEKELCGMW